MQRFPRKGKGKGKSQAKGAETPSASSATKKQYVTDFNYYLGSAKQASDYETTTKFMINYIKKLYDYGNDIGSVLRHLNQWTPRSGDPQCSAATMRTKQFRRMRIVSLKLSSRPITTSTVKECRRTRTTRLKRTPYCGKDVRRR